MPVYGDENDALGGAGTIYDFTTTAVTGVNYKYLVINDAAGFDILTDEKGVDILTTQGIGANTLKSGMVVRALDGKRISGYKLASGSIALIR